MEVTEKFTIILVLMCFFCSCLSIYVPGRHVTKPPLRKEILERPPVHRYPNNFEDNVSSYESLEPFGDHVTFVNVGREEPDYRPLEFADEVEKDTSGNNGREEQPTPVPFIDTVTGERWIPNTYREVVTGTRVIVECPRGATGQFPYPPNCLYFLNCWKGRGYVQPCAPGTLFNPRTLECDFPYKVECLPYTEQWTEGRPVRTPGHGTDHVPRQHPESTPSPSQPSQRPTGIGAGYTPKVHPQSAQRPTEGRTPRQHPQSGQISRQPEQRPPHRQIACTMEGGTGLAPHPSNCADVLAPAPRGVVVTPTTTTEVPSTIPSPTPSTTTPPSTTVTYPPTASTSTKAATDIFGLDTVSPSPDNLLVEQVDASGQVLRLRGGSGPWEGYVEIRGPSPGWGLVCDDSISWTIQEASVVCRQLGYERGAEFAWQGRPVRPTDDTLKVSVDAVSCSGNEATLTSCRLSYGHQRCIIARDAVGVRCRLNSASQCNPGDANFGGHCYTLEEGGRGGAFTHGEAIQHCRSLGGHLLDINSQAESDFISEWLIQLNPEMTSIITSGVGVSVGGNALWIWEGSKKPFRFEKWWPGWANEYGVAPEVSDKPLCVEAKRVFPCDMSYYSSQEQGDIQMCTANYFYWDTEDCSITHSHPYICEKPHHNIGCVNGAGQDYNGEANVTANGMPCIGWVLDEVLPYLWPKVPEVASTAKLFGHNYCRNVDGSESQPWCFVGPHGKMELCDIPTCWSSEILRGPSEEKYKCGNNQFQCQLHECIDASWVCDGHKDCSNGRDELRCKSSLAKFTFHESSRLTGHDVEKWLQANANTCARRCLEVKHFNCLSFSYNNENGSCILSNSNIGLSGDVQVHDKWNYYERKTGSVNCDRKFVCANGKCINASAECDGKNDCGDRSDERNCSIEYLDYSIRLSGGNTSYEGRVEVKVFGRWGVICDDQFGLRDAEVVCRELGFPLGAVDVKSNSLYGPQDSNPLFLVDDLQCLGNETSIRECDFNGWGIHDCSSDEVAGVVCKVPGKECPDNNWQCKYSNECIPLVFLCDRVADCDDGSDESSACQAATQIRLVGGSNAMEGRMEVLHMGTWGTVCDDDFTSKSASVVCRSLGFVGPAEVRKDAAFGAGDGPIWMDQVHCEGNETRVEECFHSEWGQHNCKHDEDVGVVCTPGKISREQDVTSLVAVDVSDSDNYLFPVAHILPTNCGARNLGEVPDDNQNSRVIGGKEVVKGMYPWQASVRVRGPSKSMHWCGAVIVSPLHVLSAGHCLNDYNKEAYYIRVADHDTEVNEGSEQEVNIEEIYFHEQFNKGVRLNNDIALVKLKGRGIILGTYAQPICLPPPDIPYPPGLNCTISGWGSTKSGGSGYARRLQSTWLPILPRDTCKASFVYGAKDISDGMFCAGHLEGGVDACQGDSGGPMGCLHEGHFTLFGIISWGHGCGRPNKPGVYTNVAYYRQWIDQKIQDSVSGR